MKYLEPVGLLVAIVLTSLSFPVSTIDACSMCQTNEVTRLAPWELELQLGLSSADSGQPPRVILVGNIKNNQEGDAITLSSFPSAEVGIYAVRHFDDQADAPLSAFGPQTLNLHSRGGVDSLTVTVGSGESARVVELDLVEILDQSPELPGRDSKWSWDWPSRSQPPLSPLFDNRFGNQSQSVSQVSIWFEVTINGSTIQSNVLKIPVVLPQP
ncbi:MAG: hypothetical protein ACR2NP_10060 [Pirellulaceae bacterium]